MTEIIIAKLSCITTPQSWNLDILSEIRSVHCFTYPIGQLLKQSIYSGLRGMKAQSSFERTVVLIKIQKHMYSAAVQNGINERAILGKRSNLVVFSTSSMSVVSLLVGNLLLNLYHGDRTIPNRRSIKHYGEHVFCFYGITNNFENYLLILLKYYLCRVVSESNLWHILFILHFTFVWWRGIIRMNHSHAVKLYGPYGLRTYSLTCNAQVQTFVVVCNKPSCNSRRFFGFLLACWALSHWWSSFSFSWRPGARVLCHTEFHLSTVNVSVICLLTRQANKW